MKKFNIIFFVLICITHIQNQTKNFVLISAPGSGKGTFSQYMKNKHDYIQICPGDLFRKEILNQTELGKQIQNTVESGQYVDESIVCNIIKNHLTCIINQKKNFIIDGFPRSEYSMSYLLQLLQELEILDQVVFIQLECPDEICIQRIINRIICNQCNFVSSKDDSINEPRCKQCNNTLTTRKGDSLSIAHDRLQYFHENIEPLLHKDNMAHLKIIKICSNVTLETLEFMYENLLVN